jgi:hypothetical protein
MGDYDCLNETNHERDPNQRDPPNGQQRDEGVDRGRPAGRHIGQDHVYSHPGLLIQCRFCCWFWLLLLLLKEEVEEHGQAGEQGRQEGLQKLGLI